MDKAIYSAIDANINRALEGLRVCEDFTRFHTRSSDLSARLKELRHKVVQESKKFQRDKLLFGRDVLNDSQKFFDLESERKRRSIQELLTANIHRAIEAVRSLEEFYKLFILDNEINNFQEIRFSLYTIEKELIALIQKEEKIRKFNKTLYSILDSAFIKDEKYIETALEFIKGGASILQLRMKGESTDKIFNIAKKMTELCREKDVVFIMNDHPDIAYLSGADGVHLGQDDMPVSEVRRLIPDNMLIGLSTHSYEQAVSAVQCSPDYIAIGPVYDTGSKNKNILQGIGTDIISRVCSTIDLPVVAIGGITPERAKELSSKGCSCFAVISYLYRNSRYEENCREMVKAIRE